MPKKIGDWLAGFLLADRVTSTVEQMPSLADINPMHEMMAPFGLGINETKANARRHRKDIYTTFQDMRKDPSIAEGIGLHVQAALGGDGRKGDVIYMTPTVAIRGDGQRAKALKQQVEDRAKHLQPLINKIIFKWTADAITFGDGYARVKGSAGIGLSDILCNEYTYPPLIEAFEQGSQTVGFYALEQKDWQRRVTALTTTQMARIRMPRIADIPQYNVVNAQELKLILLPDRTEDMPIMAASVGGSFLYEIEESWKNVTLTLAAMNSQQIADAVSQEFLTVDMSGMPPDQQRKYKKGLVQTLQKHRDAIRSALSGGESIWAKQYHILPVWGDKQVLNPMGNLGERSTPINIETFMINVRRMMGGMGLDPSLVGWADMLAGGLGDGAAFHTSAQIQRRSIMIRQALQETLNHLADLDWGYAYGEQFSPADRPWQFEFYSDQSAAVSEELNNKSTRMNAVMMIGQAIAVLKETGLSEKNLSMILENTGGLDMDQANSLAADLAKQPLEDGMGAGGSFQDKEL